MPARRHSALLIEQAPARAVRRVASGAGASTVPGYAALTVTIEFIRSEMADAAAIMPGSRRLEGKRVAYTAQDMPEAYRAFRTLVGLASS